MSNSRSLVMAAARAPALVAAVRAACAPYRFLEFFTAQIEWCSSGVTVTVQSIFAAQGEYKRCECV